MVTPRATRAGVAFLFVNIKNRCIIGFYIGKFFVSFCCRVVVFVVIFFFVIVGGGWLGFFFLLFVVLTYLFITYYISAWKFLIFTYLTRRIPTI